MESAETMNEIMSDFGKSLQADGGDIELVNVANGIVKVRIKRTSVPVTFSKFLRKYKTRKGVGCGRCQIPASTIAAALESTLKDKIPGIMKVEVVK
jgi:Fe-S cluster biogenesis protein NfuA